MKDTRFIIISQCQQYHLIRSEMFRVNLSLCDSEGGEGTFLPLLRVLPVDEVERVNLSKSPSLDSPTIISTIHRLQTHHSTLWLLTELVVSDSSRDNIYEKFIYLALKQRPAEENRLSGGPGWVWIKSTFFYFIRD